MFAFLTRYLKPAAENSALDAFQRALTTSGGRWYSACLRITQNHSMAEDALQDALVKAWLQHTGFRGQAELNTWIHRIAVNCAIDQLRARRHFSEEDLNSDLSTPLSEAPDAMLQQQHQAQQLTRALKVLTTQERVCFELKHGQDWKLEEIATELGISLNSTKQALFRAVRKLRSALPNLEGAT